ncbi:MAG TPA: ABC transporter substrate-binding protein [Pseudonocardia sp.]|uniref:ABC transporter substrate-binding protein n=1 Tax=Pseudonocardia sp. TaxID=60912 RepID=UPI002C7DE6E3|nr:ABC transporter substrate-binding protein [Pseudonocardia sp.]HTF50771.1 ABC transporter substrate-binding protein [Pseudonocardia sp.]
MKLRGYLAALGVVVACLSVACAPGPRSNQTPTVNLEVVSWWTSGSEQQALNVLFDAYRAAHPGVTVTNGAVVGGGGSNAQVVLAQRLLSGNPPDVWQTFPGGALRAYVDQGQVADVSHLYGQSGLAAALPEVIRDGLTVDGRQYGVPTSSHRGNMLFYNIALLAKAGVAPPGPGYSLPTFLTDLEKLDRAGVTPLCLGAKDPFTTTALFENTLLSVVGADGWRRIAQDRFDWNSASVEDALLRFGQILDFADPRAAALTWDAATKKLAAGECAFETLNDSAFGELISAGAVDGKTFGEVPYPGTDGTYVAVVDTFVQARQAANARNTADFLAVLGAPDTQLAFSKAKGSVPIRTDVDVSSLTPYQRSAAAALRGGTVLWSIVHGEAMRPQFQQGFYDAVATYVRSRDAKTFRTTLTDALRRQAPPK